ncbi:MAG: hypothetical protein C0603_09415 [Denitrovibrio sp.]|nr:MAG: hypothetical protein C0603_09415 [Denitrovibrio sp.]
MRGYLLALISIFMFMLAGCGGGGSSNSIENNLKISDIEQPSESARAGFIYEVNYTINSDIATSDEVQVSFYMIHKNNYDAEPTETEIQATDQYYLGADNAGYMQAGENTKTATLYIPADVATSGEYFLYARLDPQNILIETNEDDNDFVSVTDDDVVINVVTTYVDDSNIYIEEFELDDPVIVVDDEDLADDTVDLTAEYPEHGDAMLTGYATVVAEGADITVATLNNLRIKAQVDVNGTWRDLYYWNNDTEQYADYINFRQLEDDAELEDGAVLHNTEERYTVQFEANIPDAVLSDMLDAIDADFDAGDASYSDFRIRLFIDSSENLTETDEEDNYKDANISLYTYPDARAFTNKSLVGSKSYKVGDSKKVSMAGGISTETKMTNTSAEKSARITNNIYNKVSVMGHSRNLIDISERAANVLSRTKSSYGLKFELFGKSILDKNLYATSINANIPLAYTQSKTLAAANFVVGIVPVVLEVGTSGSIGAVKQIKANSSTSTYGILNNGGELPSMNLDLYGSAGVGSSLGSWSVGPVIGFDLIRSYIKHNNKVTANYNSSTNTLGTGTMTNTITGSVQSLNGKVGILARYKTVKICRKWVAFYPCGIKDMQSNFYLYKTKYLLNKKSTWFKKTVNF